MWVLRVVSLQAVRHVGCNLKIPGYTIRDARLLPEETARERRRHEIDLPVTDHAVRLTRLCDGDERVIGGDVVRIVPSEDHGDGQLLHLLVSDIELHDGGSAAHRRVR